MFKSLPFRIATDFVLPPLEALEEVLQTAHFMPWAQPANRSAGAAAWQQKHRNGRNRGAQVICG
jgi:recombination associated protein RdgC